MSQAKPQYETLGDASSPPSITSIGTRKTGNPRRGGKLRVPLALQLTSSSSKSGSWWSYALQWASRLCTGELVVCLQSANLSRLCTKRQLPLCLSDAPGTRGNPTPERLPRTYNLSTGST